MKRVLVVDDDNTIRRLVAMHLNRKGVTVEFAANGLESVKMAQNHDYFLIFIDVHMPELNGIDAVKAIRAEEATKGIVGATIVAMSSDEEVRGAMLLAGANEFYLKTEFFQQLPNALPRWFGTVK